jgi:hypothetical protein
VTAACPQIEMKRGEWSENFLMEIVDSILPPIMKDHELVDSKYRGAGSGSPIIKSVGLL